METKKKKEVARKYRGVATLYPDGQVDFRPHAEGQPQHEGLTATRNSKLYRTVGKEPKEVAHLSVKAGTADPFADMLDELRRLYPDHDKSMPPLFGRRLFHEDGIDLRLNEQERTLECMFHIALPGCLQVSNQVLTVFQKINSCLAYNENSIKPLTRVAGKSSTK